ncbi:phosphohydrolase [Acetobacter conturbans]|uniref:Phosphohydrolase n=1 Tax=Acetobacter conturbans TaxID=1737472 RepID=A0ABX0JZA5_9PROT|nr:phosphohydrolase [Acetobacter conturbans]NHN88212.1 phosphohydrolase [Acetobacter conturbans]
MPDASSSTLPSFTLPSDLTDWRSVSLSPHLSVVVTQNRPVLAAETEARIDAIWTRARAARPRLFNGRIFCADQIAPDRITGHWTEYRLALAQMTEPLIFGERPLHQLAVCGLLRCADGLILARRNPASLYLGGFWQSPPAGTVEARTEDNQVSHNQVSLAAQILAEAEEELGLSPSELTVGVPRLAVIHGRTRIVDVGVPLITPLSFTAVHERWASHANREYDRLELVPDPMKAAWSRRDDILPTTRLLLDML